MPAYNQDEVIDQLNKYLKLKRRKLHLEYGYCHGFTLLWLYKMSEGQEQWFYDLIKKIVSHKGKKFDDIELDIEKLLNHIEWLQNSSEYISQIQQLDIDKILGMPRDLSLSYVFNSREFTAALKQAIQKNKMTVLSGPTHTIGVFERENKFFIFDPNNDEGIAKECTSIHELQKYIVKYLFTEFKLPSRLLPVTINVVDTEQKTETVSKMGLFKQMIPTTKKVNLIGPQGITPLYIACEAGDEAEVKALLAKKVDINHQLDNGVTALYIAAQNGYVNIVRMLLAHYANPNIQAKDLITPLKAAAEKGHEDVVSLLLKAKVNCDARDKDNESALDVAADNDHLNVVKTLLRAGASLSSSPEEGIPSLRHAIKNRNWEMAVLILAHVKNKSELNTSDLRLLRRNSKLIKEAFDRLLKLSRVTITTPLIQRILNLPAEKSALHSTHLFTNDAKKRKAEWVIRHETPELLCKKRREF